MSNITYLTGDATRPQGPGPKIIVHVCNDIGGWGRGFVLALTARWPAPEASYREWHKGRASNGFALGAVQLVEVEQELWVANLVGQRDVRSSGGVPPVRYDAIREGVVKVAEHALAKGATVHMPRIGCGLAGGRWEAVEAILVETLSNQGVAVTVYDLG